MENSLDAVALNPQPLLPNQVRVLAARAITFDPKKVQKLTATLLGRLGYGDSHSGHGREFQEIRNFIVDPKTLDVRDVPEGISR